jgi:hypothetical protein
MQMSAYSDNFHLIDFSKEIVLPAKRERRAPARSDLPCPRLASDIMEPVQSQVDGRMYDSKSAIRAHYRQAGVIEVGNDPARLRPFVKPRVGRKEVKDAVAKAKARFERGERNIYKGR